MFYNNNMFYYKKRSFFVCVATICRKHWRMNFEGVLLTQTFFKDEYSGCGCSCQTRTRGWFQLSQGARWRTGRLNGHPRLCWRHANLLLILSLRDLSINMIPQLFSSHILLRFSRSYTHTLLIHFLMWWFFSPSSDSGLFFRFQVIEYFHLRGLGFINYQAQSGSPPSNRLVALVGCGKVPCEYSLALGWLA